MKKIERLDVLIKSILGENWHCADYAKRSCYFRMGEHRYYTLSVHFYTEDPEINYQSFALDPTDAEAVEYLQAVGKFAKYANEIGLLEFVNIIL